MIVLGLDTSTSSTAVALRLADGSAAEARDDPAAGAHPGHATRLLGMARELLAAAGVTWNEIDRIAVGVGPGTFTGLRVGAATARGLAQSLSTEIVGVSSTRALAAGALDVDGARGEDPAAVLAVIDARRGEVFAAAYELDDEGLPAELAAPRALAPEDVPGVVADAERAAGAPRRWLAVGDGALRYRREIESPALRIPPEGSALHLLGAGAICELGARGPAASLGEIVPDYRRRPDAELALDGAGSGSAGAR